MKYIYIIVVIILLYIAMSKHNTITGNSMNTMKGYVYENFESLRAPTNLSIMEFPPNSPSPVELYNNQPYHLLNDEFASPRVKESISCVNSRSCYATDFENLISKTGNYRQLTNNYKKEYPDNCSTPLQELVLNFYKVTPMVIQ